MSDAIRPEDAARAEQLTVQAMEALRDARMEKALPLLEEAARLHHPVAANQLGALFEHGHGVGKDEVRARNFYGIAADQGLALAQFNLAFLLHMGRGGEQDLTAARNLYRKAAEKGDATALLNLGILTARGEGGPKDATAGYALWERAAAKGEAMAAFNLGMVHAGGHDVPVNFVRGCYWFETAFRLGHPQAGMEVQKLRRVMGEEEIAAVAELHRELSA